MQLTLTHPMVVNRTKQLLDWVRSGEYDRIVGGTYMKRGEEPPTREAAADAMDHYGDRAKETFTDAAKQMEKAGKQVGEWLQTGSDWVRGTAQAAAKAAKSRDGSKDEAGDEPESEFGDDDEFDIEFDDPDGLATSSGEEHDDGVTLDARSSSANHATRSARTSDSSSSRSPVSQRRDDAAVEQEHDWPPGQRPSQEHARAVVPAPGSPEPAPGRANAQVRLRGARTTAARTRHVVAGDCCARSQRLVGLPRAHRRERRDDPPAADGERERGHRRALAARRRAAASDAHAASRGPSSRQ